MTRDYTVILPVILTVALATAVRQWLLPATIYTLKLQRRGHVVPQGLQAWDGERLSRHVMSPDFQVVSESESRNESVLRAALAGGKVLVVMGPDQKIRGVRVPCCGSDVTTVEGKDFMTVRENDHLSEVLRTLNHSGARVALVVSGLDSPKGRVLGIITEREVTRLACTAARFAG